MSDSLRIYVACLASYNNGTLHGTWIDCDGKDADDLREEVLHAVLVTSPSENAEEFAIHDHEGFGDLISEYTPLDDVAAIAKAIGGDYEIGFRWLVSDQGMKVEDAADQASSVIVWEGDRGQSRERLLGEYAQEFTDEKGGLDGVPESFRNYIDWDSMGHDWDLNGDITTFDHDGTIYIIGNPHEF